MRWKGLSETLSNSKKLLEGLCVGLFVRYGCAHGHAQGFFSNGFRFRILKSAKKFQDVFRRPTNNSSTVVNENRSFEQFRLGFEQRFDVFGGLKTGHDVFSGVL